ncbi:MAG: endonuclease/exonuclease/phosphatase family protein [Oligoflexales bacterium]
MFSVSLVRLQWIFWLFIFVVPCSGFSAESLRVASYNVENLWDHNPDNTSESWDFYLKQQPAFERSLITKQTKSPQYRGYARKSSNYYNPAVYQKKAQSLLRAIALMDEPDIIALQEIESAGGQTEVFEMPLANGQTLREALYGLGYVYILIGKQPGMPVAVTTAVISKVELVVNDFIEVNFKGLSTSARNIQVVETDPQSPYGHFVLLNGHWISRMAPNEGIAEREKTVLAVRDYMNALRSKSSNAQVILAGDFNTEPNDPVFHHIGVTGCVQGLDSSGFYSLWAEKPAEERWDLSYAGSNYALSHMLVSSSFVKKGVLRYRPGSFRVVGQTADDSAFEELIGFDGAPRQWQVRRIGPYSYEHLGLGYSDHLPLVATFDVRKQSFRASKASSFGADHDFYQDLPLRQPEVLACDESEFIDVLDLDLRTPLKFEGLCVRMEFQVPTPIWTAPGGHSAVTLPQFSFSSPLQSESYLVLGMTRADDFRPNRDDPNFSLEDVIAAEELGYSPLKLHPASNRCYVKRVLSGGGGRLKRVSGRLGFSDGVFRVHARTRADIEIVDLPVYLQNACRLDSL